MQLKFFGVRGSYCSPDKRMMEYGGKTSCVAFFKEIDGKTIPLVIDSGIGIIDAGKEILTGIFSGKCSREFTILFTHLHPDHTEGFTFFAPNFIPKVKIHLYGMYALKKNVGVVLKNKMAPPTYPIEYKDLKSERVHGVTEDGERLYITSEGKPTKKLPNNSMDNVAYIIDVMQAYAPSHPQQGAVYYRVTDPDSKKSVVCVWDIESRRGGDQRVIHFSKDADIMIHDTQYTDEEYNSDKAVVQGFGHSTYSMAIENALAANVKTLIPFHYNPVHTDEMLDNIMNQIKLEKLNIIRSKEGLVVDLDHY